MKTVLVSQRVDLSPHGERRDALDQKWTPFLLSCDLWPIFLSNDQTYLEKILASQNFDGILLTGGNSLTAQGGDAPERDNVETQLLSWAIEQKYPVLGVCRGMQVIQNHFGVTLNKIENHVANRHQLNVETDQNYSSLISQLDSVNAYHDFGSLETVPELPVIARSLDNIVMAVRHSSLPIFAQMWHPERENPFSEIDQKIFKTHFS